MSQAGSYGAGGGSGGGGLTWALVAVPTATATTGEGIIANDATVTITLPATASVGDTFGITGINNATGWSLAQRANQRVHFGTSSTMTGVAGSLASSATRDTIEFICVVEDLDFQVISSIGNITIV